MASFINSITLPYVSWGRDMSNSNILRKTYVNGFLDVSDEVVMRTDSSMCGNVGINGGLAVFNNICMTGGVIQDINTPFTGGYYAGDAYKITIKSTMVVLNNLNSYIGAYNNNTSQYANPISGNAIVIGNPDYNVAFTGSSTYVTGNIDINDISVNGNLNIDKDIVVNGLTVGLGAQSYPSNTTIGGGDVLKNILSGIYTNNTAVGYNALQNTTMPINNTAIGSTALGVNVNGTNNSAIGYASGQLDNFGSYNTYLGASTCTNNGTAIYNNSTAIGYGATINGSNRIVLGTNTESTNYPGKVGINTYNVSSYALDVSGTTRTERSVLNGNINVGKTISAIGDCSCNNRLFIGGATNFNSTLIVGSDVSISDCAFINKTAIFNNMLSLNSRLFIPGDASFNSRLIINGDASFNSRLIIGGDASLNTCLFLKDDISLNSRLFTTGDAAIHSRLFVNGDATINSRLFLKDDISLNSRLFVNGDTIINSRLFSNVDISLNSRALINGDAILNSRLFVNGNTTINSRLFINQDASLNSRLIIGSDTSLGGRLFITGDASLNGNLLIKGIININQMQPQSIINTTVSSYQLIVYEDLSLNERAFVSGDVSMKSRLTISKDISLNSRIFINGDLSLNERFFVKGNAVFQSAPVMSGTNITSSSIPLSSISSIQGSYIDVNTAQTIGGTKTFSNILTANSGILSLTDVSVNSRVIVGGDLSMGGRLFVKGDTELNGEVNIQKVLNPTNLIDGSILLSTSLPLDFTKLVTNRVTNNPTGLIGTPKQWERAALSYNGQYQTVVGNLTNIYTSNNYGLNWTSRDSSRAWKDLSISATGQYQIAVCWTNNTTGNIYNSSDYGVTWTLRETTRGWYRCAISGSGQYQTAVTSNGGVTSTTTTYYLYTSNDYGINWIERDVSYKNWNGIAMSASGKYQSGITYSEHTTTSSVYRSSNYGVNWTKVTNLGVSYAVNSSEASISMSSTGQYQSTYSYNRISRDYGLTWSSYAATSKAVIFDAKTHFHGDNSIYLSMDFGNTFNDIKSTLTDSVRQFALSGNGQFAIILIDSIFSQNANFYTSIIPYGRAIFNNSLKVVGSVTVTGAISKGSGTFDIEHPLDSSKRLVHSFIEGPRCDLIYRGIIKLKSGKAVVNIDKDCVIDSDCEMSQGTFVALCDGPLYFLRNNQSFDRVTGKIEGNLLTIICENENSEDEINWMVIAERKDNIIKTWDRTNENGYLKTEYNL